MNTMPSLNHPSLRAIGLPQIVGAFVVLWLAGVAMGVQDAAAPGPDAPATPEVVAPPELTGETVQQRLDALLANTQLTEETRAAAEAYYLTALERLDIAEGNVEAQQRYTQALEGGEQALSRLARELWEAAGQPVSDLVPGSGAAMAELEQALAAAQGQASSLRGTLGELEASLATMAARPAPLREELAAEHEKLADLQREREQVPSAEEPAALRQARDTALEARRLARVARISALDLELASLPVRREITESRRNIAKARLARVDQAVATLNARVAALQRAQDERDLAQAEQQARALAGSHPLLSSYAEESAELSRRQSETSTLSREAQEQLTESARRAELFAETRESLQQILEIGAVGEDFAELLRELQAQLPKTAPIRQGVAERDAAMIDARLQRLRAEERRRRLQDPGKALENIIRQASLRDETLSLTEAERTELAALIQQRADVLARLEESYTVYLDRLEQLNKLDADLVHEADALSVVLDERLLWLPSAAPLGRPWMERVVVGAQWLTTPVHWKDTARHLGVRAKELPVGTVLVLLVAGGLLVGKRRLSRRLAALAEPVGSVLSDSFLLTLRAAGLSLAIALPVSLLLFWAGWLLYFANGGLFVYGLGGGLMNAGIVIYILRVFQVMSRKHGLFHAHFRWSDRARQSLARNLGWMIAVLAPIAVLVPMTELSDDIIYRNGIGRLGFLVASVVLSLFLFRVLHPKRGAVADALAQRGLLWKTRLIWFPLIASAPLILGLLAAVGYYVTALKLQGQLFTSAWVSVVALILYGLALRWVVVAHRRLAVRRAREARERLAAEQASKAEGVETGEASPQTAEAPAMDLSAVSTQTRTLIRAVVGSAYLFLLYLVWRDLVPALGVLDRVALWSHTETTPNGDVVRSITLWGLLLASVILALTFIAARNLPGLLEMTTLRKLSVDAGTRYAATAIARYVIIAVGLVIAFDKVGVGWGKMQFVVAALGVGLGFGLQEIVANFVSGIIILFERPIRVGDTVTVSDLSGKVARIQIRATTIIDLDNREILVPNKSFITTNVINWTLTDPITRCTVSVGIAYGSDTTLAHRVISEVVEASQIVLDKPAPAIFFLGFGESSLDFEVRVFVKDFLHRWPVRHELHMEIDKALRKAGIEIPFPQRDLHLRSSDIGSLLGSGRPEMPAKGQEATGPSAMDRQQTRGDDVNDTGAAGGDGGK